MSAELTTAEVMRLSGFSRQRLYSYSTLGLIEPSGHGRYPAAVLDELKLIVDLNRSGYPLREIREIFFRRRIEAARG
ncbi:MAG: MerR family transcriptional regulator [Planctomycetota bacterium]